MVTEATETMVDTATVAMTGAMVVTAEATEDTVEVITLPEEVMEATEDMGTEDMTEAMVDMEDMEATEDMEIIMVMEAMVDMEITMVTEAMVDMEIIMAMAIEALIMVMEAMDTMEDMVTEDMIVMVQVVTVATVVMAITEAMTNTTATEEIEDPTMVTLVTEANLLKKSEQRTLLHLTTLIPWNFMSIGSMTTIPFS